MQVVLSFDCSEGRDAVRYEPVMTYAPPFFLVTCSVALRASQWKGTRAATCWTDQSLLSGFVMLEVYRGRGLFENHKLVFLSSFGTRLVNPDMKLVALV